MDRSSIVLTAEQQLLVENSLEFVHWTIAKLIPKSSCHMEYDDLFQEGCVALCHAAASYHGGTSFKTYAITVIRNHLIDCCRKQTSWRKYISEQSLDDPDANLPTPVCTDYVHFSGVDTGAVLTACKKHYRGVAKLGVDALVLKTKGFDCKDIAALYHTSSNNVGAWISRALPDPFIVLATQNPAGSAGTQMLPNSQLDRFLVKLTMGYPDFKSQVSILEERHTENPLDRVQPVVGAEELNALKQRAAAVEMKTSVYEYVTRLAEATRVHPLVQLGLSPRGALAVCRMAKAYAYVQGRDYAMPEDVAAIFPDVCCHRLMLSTKARMMERSAEQIVDEILKNVEMPVIRKSREGV